MPTNGDEIKDFIITEMNNYPEVFDTAFLPLNRLVDCIAKGVYEGLKNLDDTAGTIPSKGHI